MKTASYGKEIPMHGLNEEVCNRRDHFEVSGKVKYASVGT
jgi:hypothetical protein